MKRYFDVDVRNTQCPGLYGLLGAVRQAEEGDEIALLTSAPTDLRDIPAWVAKARYELRAESDDGSEWKLTVRRTR